MLVPRTLPFVRASRLFDLHALKAFCILIEFDENLRKIANVSGSLGVWLANKVYTEKHTAAQ